MPDTRGGRRQGDSPGGRDEGESSPAADAAKRHPIVDHESGVRARGEGRAHAARLPTLISITLRELMPRSVVVR